MDSGAAEDGSEPDRPLSGLSGPGIETSRKAVPAGQGWTVSWRGPNPAKGLSSFLILTSQSAISQLETSV